MIENALIRPKLYKPRVGILSIHPAPYRDCVFSILRDRGVLECEIFQYFDMDHSHSEWKWEQILSKKLSFPVHFPDGDRLHLGMVNELIKGQFNVILIPGYSRWDSIQALLFCICTRTRYILNIDSILRYKLDGGIQTGRHTYWLRFILRHASAFWVPGKGARNYLRFHGIPDNRIYEGGYCFDSERLRFEVETFRSRCGELRRIYEIPENGFVFLSVGKMLPFRRFKALAEKFGEIESSSGAYLVIVGDGPDRDSLQKVCDNPRLKNIRLLEPVPFNNLASIYALADAYVHAGSEPFSTAMEYAAIAGLPIVSTSSVGYVIDLLERGARPLLSKVANDEELVNNMVMLANNRDESKRLGIEMQKIALARNALWAAGEFERAVHTALSI